MTQSHLKQIVHAHFEECDDVFLCICHTSVCLFLFYQGFYGAFVGTFDNGCFVLLFPIVDRLLIIDILDRGQEGVSLSSPVSTHHHRMFHCLWNDCQLFAKFSVHLSCHGILSDTRSQACFNVNQSNKSRAFSSFSMRCISRLNGMLSFASNFKSS